MSKPPGQKAPKGKNANASLITDPRFSNIHTDPRYRLPSKKHTHVKLDKRFSRMLKDEDFSRKASVDRYGRRLESDKGRKELERLYQVEDDEEEDGKAEDGTEDAEAEDAEVDDDEAVEEELARVDKKYDPARDGGFSTSDSSSDEEMEDEDAEIDGSAFPDMQVEEQTDVPMGEVSSRIAVVNLDWDNIRAADLMAVFSSFVPPNGRLSKVTVYPSEFGRERMEREEMEGPPKEIFAKGDLEQTSTASDDGGDESDEEARIRQQLLKADQGEEFDGAKLRRYQLERLRYFYAVLECSSKEVAQAIYEATDGTEYLTSANFFDLRFIPDEVSFDGDMPRDECIRIPDGYRPNDFVTDALQHSKVKLTWDAEDLTRKDVIGKAFSGSRTEINENDLRAYIGSDSGSESEDDSKEAGDLSHVSRKEQARAKLRAALGLPEKSEKPSNKAEGGPVGEMQITFTSGLSSKGEDGKHQVFENEPITETTAEKYARKARERKAMRKENARARRKGLTSVASNTTTPTEAQVDEAQDLGFDDPFFTTTQDDDQTKKSSNKKRKEARRLKREAEAAESKEAATKRAELELLMIDDKEGEKVAHFDMNEIARAEKRKRKSKHRKRDKDAQEKTGGQQEGFKMDVKDPRFAALFESADFAIDPTNPKFKDTEGMKKLLEEGRRKRKGAVEDVVVTNHLKKARPGIGEKEEDLQKLLARVKNKTRGND